MPRDPKRAVVVAWEAEGSGRRSPRPRNGRRRAWGSGARVWPAAFALVLVLVPAGEAGSQTGSQSGSRECAAPTIELTAPWRPPGDPEYVASFEDFTPDFSVGPDEQWKQLGEHRTRSILEVGTEVETRCDTSTCRTCITAITARIGFTPSEIRLHEDLRTDRCARKLTMLHEEQHAAVTRKAQAMALKAAKRNLAWAGSGHAAHETPSGRPEAGQEAVMDKVTHDLTRAMDKAVAYSERENARLDLPERYRRESRKRWRICKGR